MRQALEMLAQGQSAATLRETSVELAELLSKCVSDFEDTCQCTLGDRIRASRDAAVDDVNELRADMCSACGNVGTIGENGRDFCSACGAERS